MKWNLGFAGSLLVLAIQLDPAPVDACGVKLTVKTNAPRRAVARSSNPQRVLLVGSPPRRLERDLSAAGHAVEVVPDSAAAKRDKYAIVIVDSNDQAGPARARFGEAIVVVRTNDVVADLRSVEDRVVRTPSKAIAGKTVVAAREDRVPVAVGPAKDEKRPTDAKAETTPPVVVAAVEPAPAVKPTPAPAVKPTPPPTPPPAVVKPPPKEIVASAQKDETPAVRERKPDPAPRAVATGKDLRSELYFATASADPNNAAQVAKAAAWLTAHADVNVVIEGHADPSGSEEANMALSQTRAETVRDALVAAGIDSSRLEVLAFGETKIKYGASDSRNRRVVITVKK